MLALSGVAEWNNTESDVLVNELVCVFFLACCDLFRQFNFHNFIRCDFDFYAISA